MIKRLILCFLVAVMCSCSTLNGRTAVKWGVLGTGGVLIGMSLALNSHKIDDTLTQEPFNASIIAGGFFLMIGAILALLDYSS
ncbi:MAG: hypothetical protein LBD22_04255 [Spirochaetaceae bacterium]|jgi:hypothetical protein|nr:hypothetical protein [Spirochaetaceae bacterium]